ncbi:hypothetical protein CsSME_00038563 [Camellia sinensis var. sinensis]
MSFQNFWMAKGPGCLTDGEMAYDNSSRIEPKRSHQWFMDGTEAELFPNKKQAVEVPSHNSFPGLLNASISPWGNASNYHSATGQFTERLFDPETARTVNFDDRNMPSAGTGNINMGMKVIQDQFGRDSSFGLSISHTLEDPSSGLNYGGIRKVKVNQVKDSENFMSVSMGHAYNRGDNNTMSASHAYGKADDNTISMGLSFNRGNDIVPMGNTYNRVDNNFISMGQPYNKGDGNTMSIGHPYKGNNNAMSMDQSFNKGVDNMTTMGQTFNKEDVINFDDRNIQSVGTGNINMGRKVIQDPFGSDSSFGLSISHTLEDPRSGLNFGGIRKVKVSQVKDSENFVSASMGHAYNKGNNNTMSTPHAYAKADDNNISMGLSFNRGNDNIISTSDAYNRVENNFMPMGPPYNKGDDSTISIGHSYKGTNNAISLDQSFSKGVDNVTTMGQTFNKEDGINFDDRSIPSVGTGNINMGRKVIQDPFGSHSSFGLSISHTLENPRSGVNYGGIRKVKVSQVKDTENFMSASMGHAYNRGDNNTMSTPHAYGKANDNTISMGLSFNRSNDDIISMGDTYNRVDNNFISMAQPYNKGDDSTISMDQSFSKGEDNITTMGQTFNKEDGNNLSMRNTFKDINNSVSMGQSFSKGDDSIPSMAQTFNKDDGKTILIGKSFNKLDDSAILMGHIYNNVENNTLSMSHSFGKGESNIISFVGCQDNDDINSSGRLISGYDLLMGQSSAQRPEAPSEKDLGESNVDALESATKVTSSASETVSKKEDQKGSKKVPSNNFPSNVKSLLATGMLDGLPVKYVALSQEKELHGIIKDSGFLCGCQSCNFSKAINAYEFERHAGCKTKHPNNHIYFENGKTVYGIVQELKNTPQNLLFEVIQTITGSPLNQKYFRLWKESFAAATCELQRIYGKDEGKQLS